MIDVKENMKAIQREKGLSNKEIAAKMVLKDKEVSEQSYSNWFQVARSASVEFIISWCTAIHVPVYYPFTYPEKFVSQDEVKNKLEEKEYVISSLVEQCKQKDEEIKELKKKISKERPMQAV